MMRHRIIGPVRLAAAMAVLLAAMLPMHAAAQGYPDKTVRVVVPFPAGGAADIVARQVTTRLSTAIGQQIVVDNRGGAGGAIGADNIARAPADGYSLLFASSSVLSIMPHMRIGSISVRASRRKSDTGTLSNDDMNAMKAPASTPGRPLASA